MVPSQAYFVVGATFGALVSVFISIVLRRDFPHLFNGEAMDEDDFDKLLGLVFAVVCIGILTGALAVWLKITADAIEVLL